MSPVKRWVLEMCGRLLLSAVLHGTTDVWSQTTSLITVDYFWLGAFLHLLVIVIGTRLCSARLPF